MSTIGNRLEDERKRLGHNQTQFAALGSVGRKTQGFYEAGERYPDASYLAAIAEAGADVLYVVTGKHAAPTAIYSKRDQATSTQSMVQDSTPKSDGLHSSLDHLRLLEMVIRAVERNRPHMQPDNKAKLITLLCEWARIKYEEAEEADEEFELDDTNVIRIADVLRGK